MTKYDPDIVLSGENFSPKRISELYGVNLEMAHEKGDYNPRLKKNYPFGYAILRPRIEGSTDPSVIKELIDEYKMITQGNPKSIGVEDVSFHLVIGTIQSSATFFSSDIREICDTFPEFHMFFYEYEYEDYENEE